MCRGIWFACRNIESLDECSAFICIHLLTAEVYQCPGVPICGIVPQYPVPDGEFRYLCRYCEGRTAPFTQAGDDLGRCFIGIGNSNTVSAMGND